ncbi:MAG TPA: methylated-DNA--[protein]-cysteine S-methyltransferase [Candidatus Binataceae bacterium]|nr:methylated-DNA--[protein]-cysteine S-methyltransferase [Candidatus Binataceae bacterium]
MSPQHPVERYFSNSDIPDETLDHLLREARQKLEPRMRVIRRSEAAVGITKSPYGPLLIAVGPAGLLMVHYLNTQSMQHGIAMLRLKFDPIEDAQAAEQIGDQIRRFAAGERDALEYKSDLSLVTGDFQRRALQRLMEVPFGAVITYHALAATIGAPSAQRAVGNAMATNPIPIYVPCHRVVRSDGIIGHYGGGTQCKVELLRTEGFAIGQNLRLPAQAVCGHRVTHIFCRPDCSAARRANPDKTLIFATAESARHAGLRACKLCHPQ